MEIVDNIWLYFFFDEATSSPLDSETEHIIQAALDKAAKICTAMLLPYRLSTIRKGDFIHVFDQARIIEPARI